MLSDQQALKLLLIIGASGSGKTSLAQALAKVCRSLTWVHPDGLMNTPNMQPEEILDRSLCWAEAQVSVSEVVLDCQIRPSAVEKVLEGHPVERCEIILLDCPHSVREQRLEARGWDGRDFGRIHRWAEMLRQESEEAGLTIFDSSVDSVGSIVDKIEQAGSGGLLPPGARQRIRRRQ